MDEADGRWLGSGRHGRDTPGFARVANLSDAVFAIAMTLLVLTLDTPDAGDLPGSLVDQLPQLLAFALGFGLVANLWWQHHKLFELLGSLESGLIGINLVLLGAVALVPFPTSLVGAAPTDRAAVLPFIGLFVALSALFVLLVVRAQRAGAWREPPTIRLFFWLLGRWGMGLAVMLVAFGLAWWRPVAGLSLMAVTVALGPLAARRSYRT